jgi:hypothetical protein
MLRAVTPIPRFAVKSTPLECLLFDIFHGSAKHLPLELWRMITEVNHLKFNVRVLT